MKQKKASIFRRFAIVILSLVTVLGMLFIIITFLATTNYHQASTQLLNKDVANHVAKFSTPFTSGGINKKIADSVFKNAMVMNPNTEFYFLDSTGRVLYFEADEKEIKERNIDLKPIRQYLAAHGEDYIKNIDPKDPPTKKIFSVAEVENDNITRGYIYIILGSKKFQGIMELLFGSHILNLAIKALVVIIVLSLLASFLYLQRMKKNFSRMINVLQRFEKGDYNARFTAKQDDELEPVTRAFNRMADLLSSAISKVTNSEQERKNFIAIISHDLRTPLSIARGYTETLLLKRDKGDITQEEQEQYSQLIYSKMLHIENMVKQLFELSRIEAVEFSPSKEPFVLSEIVQEVINTFQLIAIEKKIRLSCIPCDEHVWINADINMVERVIQNLVENALKSTTEGGSILASVKAVNNEVAFSIKNNGPAVPDDLLQWINDYKGDVSLGERPQKPGLGLVIIQKILHLHHTYLKAFTQNGSNVFVFSMPVYNQPA